MLLVIDVGNSHTVLGLYEGTQLQDHWRITTRRDRTVDEYGITLLRLLETRGRAPGDVRAAIVSSVVPQAVQDIEGVCTRYLSVHPLVVGPGIRTGMPILYDSPREVGADRIVNAVAAFDLVHTGCIVIDFGTATTFDVISRAGEYLGGCICPGVMVSAEALFARTSKLPRIEIVRPAQVIGKNTIASMQAGIVFGYAALVDGLVGRLRACLDYPVRVLATGGLAPLIAEDAKTIDEVMPHLTLDGLRILYERNRG